MCAQMLKKTYNCYLHLKSQYIIPIWKMAYKIKVENFKSVNAPQCVWGLDGSLDVWSFV